MKRYIITQPKEFGTYFRDDNIFTQIRIKDVLTNALVDPSDVSISIIDPCDVSPVVNDPMTSTVTGVYSYDYAIPFDACYGIYTIVINTFNEDTITRFNFVVFPWDVISRIRELSGALQQSDMSDYKLAIIAWNAYQETLEEVFELHYKERPLCNEDGEWFDGSNKTFRLRAVPLADRNGDETITGHGELACCCEDITFRYLAATTLVETEGNVTVIDAESGRVQLTDLAGDALDGSISRPVVTYYTHSKTYSEELMREAVAYLAAHKALVALKSLDKATLGDLNSNRAVEKNRFLEQYNEIIEQIGFPMIGGGR